MSLELQRFWALLKVYVIELHAIFAECQPCRPRALGPGRACGTNFSLLGLLLAVAGKNSPSKRKMRQIGPFWASRESFVPEMPPRGSRWASFVPQVAPRGSCRVSFVPQVALRGSCRTRFVSELAVHRDSGASFVSEMVVCRACWRQKLCGARFGAVVCSKARRPRDLQAASLGDMPLALWGASSG